MSSSFSSIAGTLLNQYDQEYVHKFPSIYSERTDTTSITTYPSQQFYEVPQRVRRINTLSVLVQNSNVTGSGFNWQPREVKTMQEWTTINMTKNITSDIPQYWFFYNGQIGLFPTPAAGYNVMTIRYQREPGFLATADYTTGTIVSVPFTTTLTANPASGATSATLSSNWTLTTGTWEMVFASGAKRLVTLTNGATTVTWTNALTATETSTAITINSSNSGSIVTGSGTSWATYMQGWYLQIGQTAGDGQWYEVDTVYNSTTLSLKKGYQGLAISAGSASYTVGQTSLLPETYQILPVYRAVSQYYTTISVDATRAQQFKAMADELFAQMKDDYGNKSTDPTLYDVNLPRINPNLTLNTTESTS